MNTQANNHFASVIIPRYLSTEGRSAAFFAEQEPKDTVDAYIEGKGVVTLPKAVYDTSEPLHPDDSQVVVDLYKKASGLENVQQRSRMPYRKEATKLARRWTQELGTNVSEMALHNAPAEQQPVIEEMAKRRPGRPPSAKSQAAKLRMQEDIAKAAATNVKSLGENATPDQKQAAVDTLARKIAELILATGV